MHFSTNSSRFQTYKSRRDSLKEDFERRKLPRRINVDGYFFSLHDLTRHKLAYVCCRKTSTKCKIKVMVAWDDLERVGYYLEDNIRVSMNLNGNIMYEAKGFHSQACIAKYNYLAQKALLKSLEERKQKSREKDQGEAEQTVIEKNVRKTLDGRKPFILGEARVGADSGVHTVILLGSHFMVEQLLKCGSLLVNQIEVALDHNEETWLISFMAKDRDDECLPAVYLLLNKKRGEVLREGFKMLLREIYQVKSRSKSGGFYLPKSKSGSIYEDLEVGKTWNEVYCKPDPLLARELKAVFGCEVNEGNFWLTMELEKERKRLGIQQSDKSSLIISICQTLWTIDKNQRNNVFKKLFSQVTQENEKNLESLIFFFKNLLREKGNLDKEEEVIGFCKTSSQMHKKFHQSLYKEMQRKGVSLEIVLNILRFYELEFRQKILNGQISFDESQEQGTFNFDDSGFHDFVNLKHDVRQDPAENIDINVDFSSHKGMYWGNSYSLRFNRR